MIVAIIGILAACASSATGQIFLGPAGAGTLGRRTNSLSFAAKRRKSRKGLSILRLFAAILPVQLPLNPLHDPVRSLLLPSIRYWALDVECFPL